MITRVVIAAALVVVATVVAYALRRRNVGRDAPTQGDHHVPTHLDRRDFDRPEAEWLVVVFSSGTCQVCASVTAKARVLASAQVAVDDVEYSAAKALHDKYRIDGVPCTLVADSVGVVKASFLGPVTATDLWAAVAEAREPGSSPEPDLGRLDGSEAAEAPDAD